MNNNQCLLTRLYRLHHHHLRYSRESVHWGIGHFNPARQTWSDLKQFPHVQLGRAAILPLGAHNLLHDITA